MENNSRRGCDFVLLGAVGTALILAGYSLATETFPQIINFVKSAGNTIENIPKALDAVQEEGSLIQAQRHNIPNQAVIYDKRYSFPKQKDLIVSNVSANGRQKSVRF